MKNIFAILVALLIGISFLYAIYRFLPLGVAIAITGGCLATVRSVSKKIDFIGATGGWVFVGGVIYSFFKHGFITGLISLVIGMVAYGMAKSTEDR